MRKSESEFEMEKAYEMELEGLNVGNNLKWIYSLFSHYSSTPTLHHPNDFTGIFGDN